MLPFLQHYDLLTPLMSCTTCNKTTVIVLSYLASFNSTQPKIRRELVSHKSATEIFDRPAGYNIRPAEYPPKNSIDRLNGRRKSGWDLVETRQSCK